MSISEQLEEYFRSSQPKIKLSPDKTEKIFTSFKIFQEFFKAEETFWREIRYQDLREDIYNKFNIISNNIQNALNNSIFEQAKSRINNAINEANNFPLVYSETSTGKFLKEQDKRSVQHARGARDCLFNQVTSGNSIDTSYLNGYISALVFRGDIEKTLSSVVRIKEETLDQINKTQQTKLNELQSKLIAAETVHKTRIDEIDKDFNSIKKTQLEVIEKNENRTNSFIDEKNKRMQELENLYQEKLKLEAPAKYWETMCGEYDTIGKKWKRWALTASSLFILYLTMILYNFPGDLNEFNIKGLKATLIIALTASIGIYAIRLLIKLSTSAFHLSRDAKERHQLTYVYLALLKDKAVTEAERAIVLQAIFSRADTGLLKGEHGPTLPDSPVAHMLRNLR